MRGGARERGTDDHSGECEDPVCFPDGFCVWNRQESGHFEDRPSQKIACRRFASPEFHWITEGKRCTITTEETIFQIDLDTLRARIKFMHEGKRDWVDSRRVTPIGGTYRTLDNALGDRQLFGIENGKKIFMRKITLRDSIFSKEGVTESMTPPPIC